MQVLNFVKRGKEWATYFKAIKGFRAHFEFDNNVSNTLFVGLRCTESGQYEEAMLPVGQVVDRYFCFGEYEGELFVRIVTEAKPGKAEIDDDVVISNVPQ